MRILPLHITGICLFGIISLVATIFGLDIAHAEQGNLLNIPQFAKATVLQSSSTSSGDSGPIHLNSINGIYQNGDTLYTSGSVDFTEPNFAVEVRIFDPHSNLVAVNQVMVSPDKTFQSSISLGGSLMAESGIYSVEITYLDATMEKFFWFQSGTKSLNFDHLLFVDNYQFILENCTEVFCEHLPRNWGSPNTTFTWFNPFGSSAYFGLSDGESFDYFKVDKIKSKNILSKTLDSPGEYFYYLISFPDSENPAVHMGLIYIDENFNFSEGTKVISSSATNIDAFTLAQIDSSSAKYVHSDVTSVKIPEGSSVPGCETTFDCFTPSNLVIDLGTTVIWSNIDSAAHTVTSGSPEGGPTGIFDSSLFMAGLTFSHSFNNTGSFDYFCMVHPWQTGRVTVLNALIDPDSDGLDEGTCDSCDDLDGDGSIDTQGDDGASELSSKQETFSGDNQWNTRPSFGVSHENLAESLVKYGFKFNNEQFSITDNHHTDFEEQSINIGSVNSFSATVYADKKLKVQEFLFGIPNVGESHLAELGVEVWFDIDGNIDDVKVIQNSPVIDASTLVVNHSKTKCQSSDKEPKCDNTTISMKFLEPLKDNVMAIKAIDFEKRDQRTYLNDGFDISGESLNPMLTKMVPSNVRDDGLLKVTQVEKYSPYWVADDGRTFEMNSFGSFTEFNHKFERFQDSGEPRTRLHSGFSGVMEHEKNRAIDVFDATKIISELPDSFGHHIEIHDRITDEMKQEMLLQEEIAKKILDEMDKQDRHY